MFSRFVRSLAVGVVMVAGVQVASAINVCGPINSDATWTVANSPYVLTCDVRVLTGATLTIDPGVIVRFDQNTSLVAEGGVINAIGTVLNPLTFTSSNFSLPGNGLRVQGGKIDIRHATLSGLQNAISLVCCGSPFNPPLNVDRCNFSSNQAGISGFTLPTCTIANSYFSNNAVAAGQAYQTYSFCTFQANTAAFTSAESVTVEDCEFAGNQIAFSSPNGNGMVARRCYFHDNSLAIENVPTIERCTIVDNQVGVRIATPYLISFECNNIYQNDQWNVEMVTNVTLSAPNNWWNTPIPSQIDMGIKDGFDQTGLGFFQYAPPLAGDWTETTTCSCTIPVFNVQPITQSVYSGNIASFTASATATGTPSYQWFRNGVPLVNTARFSGVTTTTLTVNPVAQQGSEPGWTDAGQYSLRASNFCGVANSNIAILTTPTCLADFNGAGGITVQDIFDFLAAYFAGCP